jgi:hypothetical protein
MGDKQPVDTVERIRRRFPNPQDADDGLLGNEAADEIERLRAGYAECIVSLQLFGPYEDDHKLIKRHESILKGDK